MATIDRRLATIFAADFVGYSRLMRDNEEQTALLLKAHRGVIDGIVELHNGRIFNTAGDSVLAEFTSPVQAVRSAIEIQEALRTRNSNFPEDQRMMLRIGVNLGDVIAKGPDLLGDAVNIAARLESIAEPGGIMIAQSVHEHIQDKLGLRFESVGAQKLKNIPRPVEAFRVTIQPLTAQQPNSSSKNSVLRRPFVALGALALTGIVGAAALWASLSNGVHQESAALQSHWLNGDWVGIVTEEPISDPLFCTDLTDQRCRIFKMSGVRGDGRYEGAFGMSTRGGPATVTVKGPEIHIHTQRVSANVQMQPGGVLQGPLKNIEGASFQLRLRKVRN